MNATLSRRTAQLATRSRHLKRGITNRKSAEKALRQREDRHSKLLKESAQLEQRLRRLAHRLLQAQESVRRKISAGIRDEIAQTLLGISVRLLSLKTGAQVSSKHRLKEITSTQQLVARSARILQRVASGIEKAA